MKKIVFLLGLLIMVTSVHAQKYFTRTGSITFFSSTSIEDIEAKNKTVTAVFDAKTGDIQFSVTMKAFQFEKALMQEHFNENYVESDQFPKSTFKGKIINISDIDFSKDGIYNSEIEGSLTLHGVTKTIKAMATFTIEKGEVVGESVIKVNPEDFEIEIPSMVREKIAKELEVTMVMNFEEKK